MFYKNILGTLSFCLALSNLEVECSNFDFSEPQSIVATSHLGSAKILNVTEHGGTQKNEIDLFLEPNRAESVVKQLTSAIEHDVKDEKTMEQSIIDAGISRILVTSITDFLSGIDTEGSAEAVRYNISDLIEDMKELDKNWLLDIIAPLKTGNEAAKKLYDELLSQING